MYHYYGCVCVCHCKLEFSQIHPNEMNKQNRRKMRFDLIAFTSFCRKLDWFVTFAARSRARAIARHPCARRAALLCPSTRQLSRLIKIFEFMECNEIRNNCSLVLTIFLSLGWVHTRPISLFTDVLQPVMNHLNIKLTRLWRNHESASLTRQEEEWEKVIENNYSIALAPRPSPSIRSNFRCFCFHINKNNINCRSVGAIVDLHYLKMNASFGSRAIRLCVSVLVFLMCISLIVCNLKSIRGLEIEIERERERQIPSPLWHLNSFTYRHDAAAAASHRLTTMNILKQQQQRNEKSNVTSYYDVCALTFVPILDFYQWPQFRMQ